MSFHFEINATAGTAKRKLHEVHAPEPVKAFIRTAIDGALKRLAGATPIAFSIKATGHLCESATDYELSSCQIEVRAVELDLGIAG